MTSTWKLERQRGRSWSTPSERLSKHHAVKYKTTCLVMTLSTPFAQDIREYQGVRSKAEPADRQVRTNEETEYERRQGSDSDMNSEI